MSKEEFKEEFVIIEEKNKIVQVPITVRQSPDGPRYSFALLREFVRDGNVSRTPWFMKRHIADLRRVLDQVELYFEALEAEQRRK